jgi:pyruvate formate lyase activating enzyme
LADLQLALQKRKIIMLRVHSIETFGTAEGPGIRLVIFVQGCNLRCLYCHNPDMLNCKGGKEMKISEIIKIAEGQKGYFGKEGGVTVSGGEPTLQAKNIIRLFRKLKNRNINTALDSNGSVVNDDVKKLYKYTDLLLFDVKHIDDEEHKKLTGFSNKNTLLMAKYREEMKKPMWLRYVLVPGINDSEEFLERWGEHFKDYKYIERVEILPYHTLGNYKYKELGLKYSLENLSPPTKESILKTENIFKKYFKNVFVR